MNILILGGTGSMGTSLVKILSQDNNNIYVTSRHLRKSDTINYILGNAHNKFFLKDVLKKREYDIIIDFMNYTTKEFAENVNILLNNTKQYIFLSSARVYASSKTPLKESSPRLLDCSTDKNYLATDEYALAKARQENILLNTKKRNWTIIRPYITYNINRLQLGAYEKEDWLYRVLQGRALVVTKDIMEKVTTLSYGYDVAFVINKLINNEKALGEIIQITSSEYIKWSTILSIYMNIIEKYTGKRPKICYVDKSDGIYKASKFKEYQIKYDRLYDRYFDNSKMNNICKCNLHCISIEEGLSFCLNSFLKSNANIQPNSWTLEGYFDKVSKDTTPLKDICGWKNKIKYILSRYTPYTVELIKSYFYRL